jgi:hypothetical protein
MSQNKNTKSQASFERVCSLLDFSKNKGLLRSKSDTDDEYLKSVIEDTMKKIDIDAIFFIKPETVGPSAPIIYFKLMDQQAPEKIAELHKLS